MRKTFLKSILLTLAAGSVSAQGFYATVGGGWVFGQRDSNSKDNSGYVIYGPTAAPSGESIFNLPNVDWENSFDNGFDLNCAVGYQLLPAWRADVEFLYQRFDRQVTGSYDWAEFDALSTATIDSVSGIIMTPSNGKVNVYSLLTNGYYDWKLNSKWTPMLGAGFGIAWIKAGATQAYGGFTTPKATATTLQVSPVLSGTAFAWQIKAGVGYEVNKIFGLILQYRLFATSNFIANVSRIVSNPNLGRDARSFNVSQNRVNGLMNNALEIVLRFNLAS